MSENLTGSPAIRNTLIAKFGPIAILFTLVYAPFSFFILEDKLAGTLQALSLVALLAIMLFYYKTKKIDLVGNTLAFIGFPVLLPWLISGGPFGNGLWWSAIYVVWVFFITTKKWGLFWLSLYALLVCLLIVLASANIITIAYSVNELLNLLFAYTITYLLVYFIGEVIEHYSESSNLELANRKIAEEKIKKINEELENKIAEYTSVNAQLIDFCNIVSHNLRAPLVNIDMLINFLEESDDEQERKELIGKLKPVVKHLNEVFNELVESVQVKQDTEVKLDKIILKDALDKTLKGLESQIKLYESDVQINFNEISEIHYPQKYIDSIFSNLISNALKYKSPHRKPVIKIKAEKVNDKIVLSVADNGLGIDLNLHKDRLFKIRQVFHKHPDAKGFGLFLTHSQVTAMGGKIWVESFPDKGSTFFVEFKNTNS